MIVNYSQKDGLFKGQTISGTKHLKWPTLVALCQVESSAFYNVMFISNRVTLNKYWHSFNVFQKRKLSFNKYETSNNKNIFLWLS